MPPKWGNLVRHWDLFCSQTWWECLWKLQTAVVSSAEYSKKCLKYTVELPESRSIRFYMIYFYRGIWPEMQSTLLSFVSTSYGKRNRNRLLSSWCSSVQTLGPVVSLAAGKVQPVWFKRVDWLSWWAICTRWYSWH